MAERLIFWPQFEGDAFVGEVLVEFGWQKGQNRDVKRKNIASMHEQIKGRLGRGRILEISTSSCSEIGRKLSAFNLKFEKEGKGGISNVFTVESVYQGSKVTEEGGPYEDIYRMDSYRAKKDVRIHGRKVTGFSLFGEKWPVKPVNMFYDWIYINALLQNDDLAGEIMNFETFTDIEFNPKKSLNCQARSAALFISLERRGILKRCIADKNFYQEQMNKIKEEACVQDSLFGKDEIE